MKIGVDMDDVINELVNSLVSFHNRAYKTSFTRDDHLHYNLSTVWHCDENEVMDRIFEFYNSPEFDSIEVMEGAEDGLKELQKSHELVIITSRPNEMKEKTMLWLKNKLPSVAIDIHFTNQVSRDNKGHKTKAEVCRELGVGLMIDDAPQYAIDCAGNGITTLLMERPWNRKLAEMERIHKVKNWNEIVSKVKKLFKREGK